MNRPIPDKLSFANISNPDFDKQVKLVELLMYPLTTRHPNHFGKIDWTLFDIWKNICSQHIIDNEYRYIYFDHPHSYDNQVPWEDEIEEVNRATENTLIWIEKAKIEMNSLCRVLYSKIADCKTYPKHYPRTNETQTKIKNRSISNDAILLKEYTIAAQDVLFIKIIEHFWSIILTNENTVFVVETNKLTGFSQGKECVKLVCKINLSSQSVHFYPVHEDEIFKYLKFYDNPVKSNLLFKINKFDKNTHFQQNQLENTITNI
ncbi:hypothetical protein G9H61_11525 [Aquirufa ecclesiirivi]|uniref:DUF4238 domain-containing protein n=1 Tax=Aquirufa ecclesiirivi TaxID=2715124 RepID=A0ABT4JKK3_9BACT|nr:hypothetical protein [Aquirufa ecclesiirivi]MCZ2476081.1 hypothetical protein [Aquirufa ecclesiirivi]